MKLENIGQANALKTQLDHIDHLIKGAKSNPFGVGPIHIHDGDITDYIELTHERTLALLQEMRSQLLTELGKLGVQS